MPPSQLRPYLCCVVKKLTRNGCNSNRSVKNKKITISTTDEARNQGWMEYFWEKLNLPNSTALFDFTFEKTATHFFKFAKAKSLKRREE